MTDLLDQLRISLGSRYRIERELGGGGMSKVYLAEELELGRMVVLKVLAPQVAVVLSVDRFEREVRLAASLQHPHIVTLLASGSAHGILYYTMPYVEGESLRARLDREGELPVPDVVRMLREVVDALSYAHAHGVIHRDIKPDNILVSHHHAVITDFGIARALTAADERGRLTGSGISIGTPSYMAPEQAAAEREIDHRADLYSVGVLAYELLAGEPPFRGATAQAVIAAHMTRTPPPLAELRPSVPPELVAIVSRLLEKRPSDRFQKTDDLLAALTALRLSGTTGSSTAPAAAPALAPAQVDRIWPLPQVLGYFGVAGAALLGAAWGLRTLLGLPDWFFAAAVVLLALGLPIVVAAALAHNRRVSGGAAWRTPEGIHRRLTLRRAVSGGVAAFSGLGVVTAGYMGMRALGIGPVGTLVASGKLAARDRLVIADFVNQTRDSLLGPAVTQAFRVDFAQSTLVSPVEPDYVRRVLRLMLEPDSMPLTLTLARDIARRGGFKAVVAGDLRQVGPSILVSAQLVSADSGAVLFTARATARDSTGILDAVDQVSKQLRNKIGESLRSLRANPPLAEVTTGSLDALRKYSQAIRLEGQGDDAGSIALLEDAVAVDTGFAMAWRKLGTKLANGNDNPSEADAALTRAFRLRDRLTFREKKLTEDSYYSDVRGANDSAAVALQSLLAEYPDDSWAWNNLGVLAEVTGNKPLAEQAYRRAAVLEPENMLAWRNALSLQIGQGRFDSAAATVAEITRRFPPGPSVEMAEILLQLGQRDFVAAETRLRAALRRYQGNGSAYAGFLNLLAGVLAVRGKVSEADQTVNALADLRRSAGRQGTALVSELQGTIAPALYRGDRRTGKARLDEVLKAHPLEQLPERERPLVMAIRAAAAAGDQDRAGRLLDQLDRNQGNVPRRIAGYVQQLARGFVLAMRQESLPQAVVAFRKAEVFCGFCADAPMAAAFDRLGRPDSALVYYLKWAAQGESAWDGGPYFPEQAAAYFRLGELYEARQDKARAVDFYGRFTELWREADPEFQPRVKEARRRIADLIKEPS